MTNSPLFDNQKSKMTPQEVKVFDVLFDRPGGRKSALHVERISHYTGLADVMVREAVNRIITAHHIPICSSPAEGYWIPDGAEDIEECYRSLMSRALRIMERAACIKHDSKLREWIGQQKLKLKDETLSGDNHENS